MALVFLHAISFVFTYAFAYLFVLFSEREEEVNSYFFQFAVSVWGVLLLKLIVFYSTGHCHTSFRYVTFSDLIALVRSASLSSLLILLMQSLMQRFKMLDQDIPMRVLLVDWGATIFLLGGLRAAARLTREEFRPLMQPGKFKRAMIVGANQAGETLARHLQSDPNLHYLVVGFLDRDRNRYGSMLGQIPILGSPLRAAAFCEERGVDEVLVVSGEISGNELRDLIDSCTAIEVRVKVIPAIDDLLAGDYSLRIRDVDINDLLRREPVKLDSANISSLLRGKCVLVTGAGGSIGSEICRQVLRFGPKKLVLLEQAENSLFFVEKELSSSAAHAATEICPVIADVTDRRRIDQVFREHNPAVVFHAAAHKHVPMMELNPGEAVKNNILGTKLLAEMADEHGAQEFVMISTDKAVNPTSVMGVSKQVAERFVHAFSESARTKFVVVRFGNVLASNGSVVPIFQEQIRRGGPITVTHPDIERFFMTIPEASQLVLQAATMGKGGEIFVLDMGQPVKIVDLAKDLIRLSGLDLKDIPIVFTGLRPGEKLYEELYFDEEQMLPTPHPKLSIAWHRPYNMEQVMEIIDRLAAVAHLAPARVRAEIAALIPEYRGVQKPEEFEAIEGSSGAARPSNLESIQNPLLSERNKGDEPAVAAHGPEELSAAADRAIPNPND